MSIDSHIRLLPLHVANKIAAGEVVERPASALKELLENAIDAGATRIDVTVTAGGRKLVAVRDNGCGMTREDALLSLERQATSKIRDVDDIEHIATLGFRGEAIPSIASVSRFSLVTRPAGAEEGTQLTVNAGTLAEVKSCGAPPGTTVEVRDLFCNVPARRKFLRAYATEEGHIKNTFMVHALAHPDLGFALTLDGREIYRFAPGATVAERVRELFGADFAEALLPVEATLAGVRVHGFVERPDVRMEMRRDQFVFINGRPATAPAIAYALREAYPRRSAESRPAVVLFIELDPGQVDVNVHPAKREVRFRRAADVREALIAAVSGAFAGVRAAAAPAVSEAPCVVPPPMPVQLPLPPAAPEVPAAAGPAPFEAPFAAPFTAPLPSVPSVSSAETAATETVAAPTPSAAPAPVAPWQAFKLLAVSEAGYVLIETEAGIVIVHPRAARERIVFERMLDGGAHASQPLLMPETVTLSPGESARVARYRDVLAAQGFQIEPFGRDTWKIDAVPQAAGGVAAAGLLATIAHDLDETGARRGGERWREERVAQTVARAFAGAATRVTPESAVRLIEELGACRNPYVSPTGKPVMILYSCAELARKFGR